MLAAFNTFNRFRPHSRLRQHVALSGGAAAPSTVATTSATTMPGGTTTMSASSEGVSPTEPDGETSFIDPR